MKSRKSRNSRETRTSLKQVCPKDLKVGFFGQAFTVPTVPGGLSGFVQEIPKRQEILEHNRFMS